MNKHLNAIRKAGFGSLFTPTKAMSRVRAIATDRTQSSLTGGCFEPGIIRISTEFCGAEGGPAGWAQPGRATSASGRHPGPVAEAAVRSRLEDAHAATRIRSFFETRISRFARRGVHATV
jgi:hypothetical protein